MTTRTKSAARHFRPPFRETSRHPEGVVEVWAIVRAKTVMIRVVVTNKVPRRKDGALFWRNVSVRQEVRLSRSAADRLVAQLAYVFDYDPVGFPLLASAHHNAYIHAFDQRRQIVVIVQSNQTGRRTPELATHFEVHMPRKVARALLIYLAEALDWELEK